MVERLVLDLHADGRVLVTEWPSGEALPGPAVDAGWLRRPLADAPMESLRWYLEEYLRTPLGPYGERGPQIARQLPEWGARVFSALFGTGPGRDAYHRARRRSGGLEIVLRSGSPQLLALPWELMADPARPSPLVLEEGVVLSRRTAHPGSAGGTGGDRRGDFEVFEIGGSRLRALLVTAGPDDPAATGHRTIAGPLLRRVRAARCAVDLHVLRPPTLARLGEVLREAREQGRPFQLVHFDGSGALIGAGAPSGAGALTGAGVKGTGAVGDGSGVPGPHGALAFERPGGGREPVPVERVARVLAAADVPLVVLGTGPAGPGAGLPEAVAAARLLREGVHAVLALPYGIDATAAAGFLTVCYERLRAGDRVAPAVAAGRRWLAAQDRRTSPRGPVPLADWMVPVLHDRGEVALPGLRAEPTGPDRGVATAPQLREDEEAQTPAELGGFVGRDGLLLAMDAAARAHRVILLHGVAGVGKTELAKAFGRWCRETGAVDGPGAVLPHSFEPGATGRGLAGAVERIGRRLFAAEEFDPLTPAARQEVVERALATRDLLLIWDDVDAAAADPAASDQDRAELRAFLDRVARHGRSTVVLTARTREDGLGPGPLRIEVPGLDPGEAVDYAEQVLTPTPDTVRKRGLRVFGELLERLGGHPLSMRLVLSSFEVHEPWQVLDTLMRSTGEEPAASTASAAPTASGLRADGSVPTVLTVSTAYALARLDATDRRALAAVALCHGTADATVLALLSRHPLAPERFRGRGTEEWQRLLRRAADLGLLTACGGTAYHVHPALAEQLTARWRAAEPGFAEQHEAAQQALLGAQVNFCLLLTRELHGGSAEFALTALDLQRRTIGSLLDRAVDRGLWLQALALVRPLHDHWDARGLDTEARHWIDRVRLALEEPDGAPPDLDSPAGSLWLYLVGADARRRLRLGRLDEAELTLREIHQAAERQPPGPEQLDDLADCYQQLGRLAVDRGDVADAEPWYLRSQALLERLGDLDGLALGHHQLGVIAHRLGRPDDAEQRTRQALGLFERLGETGRAAACHHQLGLLAEERGRFEEAHGCYRRALAAVGRPAELPGAAELLHRLAAVAAELGRLAEAEGWCERALDLAEAAGNRPGSADAHHRLGVLAAAQERFEEAEARHRKALAIRQDIDDRAGAAASQHQLGVVATRRGDLAGAERWYARALAVREELGDQAGISAGHHQLGLTAQTGGRAADAEARYRKALDVSHRIGDTLGLARTFGQFGLFAAEQGRPREAMEWLVRSITCFEEFPHPMTWPSVVGLRRLTLALGPRAVERAWRSVTGRRLPEAVREQLAG